MRTARRGGWRGRGRALARPATTPYRSYRDGFFALIPEPGRATLEVGCGEGRVARDLAARRHRVTALDASPKLLRAAAEADPCGTYLEGPAFPLQDYAAALEAAGLRIEALREARRPEGGPWARVPMFLMWRAVSAR